jgi:peptidoglycan/LPS O-acetylase OafA/YrhL
MGDSKEQHATLRYTSLDGLRGLAALVVVIHHCLLVSPPLSAAVDSGGTGRFEPWVWWATFTPLHLVWAGHEAVYVFFILSGFVLALPFVSASRPSWAAYFPRRLVRIYLPVWASLTFALLMAWTVPRVARPELSSWINMHDEPPNVVADGLLLRGAGALNSPLWSLQWEMLFSLLLPLYVVSAVHFRRAWLPSLVGLFLFIGVGTMAYMPLPVYMPMFGVGVLMAVRRDVLEAWGRKLSGSGWACLLVLSMVLLCSHWLFPQLPLVISMAALGGALLIFAFTSWRPALALGKNPLIIWLGLRSFSLYLVHEPIVLSITFALRSSDPVQVALLALPISFLATEVFFRLVERPSHRLAGLVGRVVTDRALRGKKVSIAQP